MKRFLVLLSALSSLFLLGCSNKKTDVCVWTKPATEKILLDQQYKEEEKTNKDFKLTMVKGEYESFQILLTPTSDVSSYNATVDDFTLSDNTKFNKENISIYNQKYLEVVNGTVGGAGLPLGFYPDALLPIEKTVEYNENTIKANTNQGLWVTFKTDKDTKAGTYTGNITLSIDSAVTKVSVELTVLDYYLSEENTAKSVFPIERDSLIYGEMDNSLDMYKKYVDFLIDYRMAAYLLPFEAKNVSDFIKVTKEYASDIRVPSYAIPVYYVFNASANDIDLDYDLLEEYIMTMAKESVNGDVDLVKKAYLYIGMIDEPEMGGIIERAKRITKNVKELKEKCSKIILNDSTLDLEKRTIVAKEILNIDNLVTNKLIDKLDGYVESWVPLFDDFDSINRREEYQSRDESVWWYGCIGPKNPYPTYHLDDNLISSRILSWMQYDYNIEGNLYWETSLYQKAVINEFTGAYERRPINPYKEASRFPDVNGDGFLTYPGAPYGIDGPVASIRMHSIRDGLEEYEILQDLEEINRALAKHYGVSYENNKVLDLIYNSLYEGTKVIGDTEDFIKARQTILQLLSLATSEAKILVSDLTYEKDLVKFKVLTDKNIALYSDNKLLEANSQLDNGTYYEVVKSLNERDNNLNLSLRENETNLVLNIGGKMNTVLEFVDKTLSTVLDGKGYSKEIVENDFNEELSKKISKITINSSNTKVTVSIDVSALELGDELDQLLFKIYNTSNQKVNVNFFIECSDDPIHRQIYQGNIKPGMNYLIVNNLSKFDFDTLGHINKIHLDFENNTKEDLIVYLDYINCLLKR